MQKSKLYLFLGLCLLGATLLVLGSYRAYGLETLDYEDMRLIYGSSTEVGLYSRTWDNSAGSWSNPTSTISVATATIRWIVNKIHATSTEEILGVLQTPASGSSTILLAHYATSSWSVIASSTDISGSNGTKRSFDVEYEARSGDALFAYSDNTTNPKYWTHTVGGGWVSSSVFVSAPGSGAVEWIELVSFPGSDTVALVYSDANSDLFVVTWNGSSWDTGNVATLTTSLSDITTRNFDAAYESASGDLLVVWGTASGIFSGLRSYGSSAFTTTTAISVSSPTAIDIAPEPAGNRIAMAATANSDDFRTATWDGLKWVDAATPDAAGNAPGSGDINVAVGWVGDTGTALAVYEDSSDGTGGRIDWAKWTAAAGWAIQSDYSGFTSCNNTGGDKTNSMQIESFSNLNKLMEVYVDGASDMCAGTFTGSSWSATNSGAPLESNLSSIASIPFSVAVQPGSTTVFIADHALSQELDVFTEQGSKTDAELYRFGLNVSQGPVSVSQLVLTIVTSTGLSNSDFSGLEIVEDTDRDGDIEAGETTAIGGSGSISISGGTVTFASSFTVSSSQNYIIRGDIATLNTLDRLKLRLGTSTITTSGGYRVMGSSTEAIHQEGIMSLAVDDARLIYGEGSVTQLREASYSNSSSSWIVESSGSTVSSTIRWIVTKIHPTSTEELSAALTVPSSGSSTLWLTRYDTTGWTIDASSTEISVSNGAKRGFDVEYEGQSGDALFVYAVSSTNPKYRTRAAGSWSAELSVFDSVPGTGIVEWVELARRPGTNEIALVYSDSNSDLFTVTWSGSSWDTSAVATLETSITQITTKLFDAGFEEVSGDLLVVWGNSSGIHSAVKLSTSTSFTTSTAISVTSPLVIDIAVEPDGDRIALAALANTDDLKTATWDGATWATSATPDSSGATPGAGDMMVGAGWVGHSGTAIATYEDASDGTGARIDWAKWTSSTGWVVQSDATGFSGCNTGATTNSYHLESMIKRNKLIAVFSDSASAFCAGTYDGSSWTANTSVDPIEATLSSIASVPFSLAIKTVLPVINFSVSTSSVSESDGTSTVTLAVNTTSSQAMTVQYSISSASTATSSADFTLSNGTSTFSAGSTSTSISIPIVDDGNIEGTETLVLVLSSPRFAEIGATSSFTLSITDNEGYPSSSFVSSSGSGAESVSTATLTLQINSTSSNDITLTFATSGTAEYASDYSLSTTTAVISAGNSTTSFSVSIINDSSDESDETVVITLSTSTNSIVGSTSTYTYTISDNDDPAATSTPETPSIPSVPRAGGGGSQPSGSQGSTPSTPPEELSGFSISVNGGANSTATTTLDLTFQAPAGTNGIEIAEASAFASPLLIPYTSSYRYVLKNKTEGIKTVYARFRNPLLSTPTSQTVSDSILYQQITPPECPTSTPYFFFRNLKTGDSGGDVKELQKFLNANSFVIALAGPGSRGAETELFGAATRKALARFQEAYRDKLLTPFNQKTASGVLDLKTRNFINSLQLQKQALSLDPLCPAVTNQAPVISSTTVSSTPSSFTISFKTNQPASVKAEYDLTRAFTATTPETDRDFLSTEHSITVTDLPPCTVYRFRVRARNWFQNERISSPGTAATRGCPGDAVILQATTSLISPYTGGTLDLIYQARGFSLQAPEGYNTASNFQLLRLSSPKFIAGLPLPKNTRLLNGHTYLAKPLTNPRSVLRSLNRSARLTLRYTASEAAALPKDTTPTLFHYENNSWSKLQNCSADAVKRTVTCDTSAFSPFFLGYEVPANQSGAKTPPVSKLRQETALFLGLDEEAPSVEVNPLVSLLVNDDAEFATAPGLSLTIDGPDDVSFIAISESILFREAVLLPYTPFQEYILRDQSYGDKTIFVRLQRTPDDFTLPIASDRIVFARSGISQSGQSSVRSSFRFTRLLELGSSGEDVRSLQIFLNQNGFKITESGPGSPGRETTRFGALTKQALGRFQLQHGIVTQDHPAFGVFGPKTRGVVEGLKVSE